MQERKKLLKGGIKKMQKQKQLLAFSILASFLCLSLVAASGLSYSLRGSGGDILQINGESNFNYEKVSFSAYYSEGSSGSGQGSVYLLGVTPDRERYSVNVKLVDPVIVRNDNILKVENTGYYNERVKTWYGMWTTQRVEGKVTYTFNKNTGETTIVGSNGLNFKAVGVQTYNLR